MLNVQQNLRIILGVVILWDYGVEKTGLAIIHRHLKSNSEAGLGIISYKILLWRITI